MCEASPQVGHEASSAAGGSPLQVLRNKQTNILMSSLQHLAALTGNKGTVIQVKVR